MNKAWIVTTEIEGDTFVLGGFVNKADAEQTATLVNTRANEIGWDLLATVEGEVEIRTEVPTLAWLYEMTGMDEGSL